MGILRIIVVFLQGLLSSRTALAAENLALRQQLAVLRQSVKRPKLRPRDRLFWVVLSHLWMGLAAEPAHLTAGHGGQMAPSGLQNLLALEI